MLSNAFRLIQTHDFQQPNKTLVPRRDMQHPKQSLAPQLTTGLILFCVCFVSGGATCARRRPHSEFQPPVVLRETPTLQQLVDHTNQSFAVQRIESNSLTITSPGLTGNLSGNLQWERPHNFNLQAYMGSQALGTVLAAGSNSEMFWLQTKMPPPATLYYARHDEFESQLGPRHILPVSPLWLREALGIIEFDPSFEHQGPTVRSDGRLVVNSFIPSPRGPYRRVVVFAPNTLVVEETTLYDQSDKLVARAQLSEPEYFSAIKTSLPHKVIVELIPDDGDTLSFTIDVGFYLLNQTANPQTTAFTMPDSTGLSTVDLVQANAQIGQPPATVPPVYRSTTAVPYPTSLDNYRR